MQGPSHFRLWAVSLAFGTLTVLSVSPVHAQDASAAVLRGSRIRLIAPAAGIRSWSKGVVDSANTDLLFVQQLSEPPELRRVPQLTVPMSAITRLEVRLDQRSRGRAIGAGALVGLAAGIVVPIAIAAGTGSVNEPDSWGWGGVAIGVATIVPWTSAIGAVVGAMLPVDRWRRIIPASK